MPVELTPNGTYGVQFPKIPRPLMTVGMTLLSLNLRLRGGQILSLTTAGSKTGRLYTVDLSWFPGGDNTWLIVGSAGGAAKHPAWVVNMARNPDKIWIEIDKRKIKVQPQSLKGAEREQAWQQIVSVAPGYRAYQEKTDREIPVIRLKAETA